MFEPEPTGMGQDHESRLSTQKNGWFATKPTSVGCCAPPSQETRDRADRTGSLSRLHRSSFLRVRRTEERWKTQIRGYHVKPQEKLLQGVCLDFFFPDVFSFYMFLPHNFQVSNVSIYDLDCYSGMAKTKKRNNLGARQNPGIPGEHHWWMCGHQVLWQMLEQLFI